MKENKFINCSLPAFLQNFSEPKDGRTHAKLKVFYKGETGDGRIFTEEFAEKVKDTLPYAPVVAFYDEEEKDFVGHNTVQYIYGLVKGNAELKFEQDEDGKEWLIAEVMLYTDRVDNIGEVAKKIVGQPQSLELDPNNVEYEFIKVNGQRKIKFLNGQIVGLSVLGTNERPAFTGSEFFKDFKVNNAREKFELFLSHLEHKSERGENGMNDVMQKYAEFASKSYTEELNKAYYALQAKYKDVACSVWLLEMTEKNVIYGFYDWNSGEVLTYRVAYVENDGALIIGDDNVVVSAIYLTAEEKAAFTDYSDKNSDNEEGTNGDESGEGETSDGDEGNEGDNGDGEEGNDGNCESGDEGAEGEGDEGEETSSSDTTASLLEEERANNAKKELELEELKKALATKEQELTAANKELEKYVAEKKQELAASYKDVLEDEVLEDVMKDAEGLTYEELEVKLALAFAKDRKKAKGAIPFSMGNYGLGNNVDNTITPDELTKKWANKS